MKVYLNAYKRRGIVYTYGTKEYAEANAEDGAYLVAFEVEIPDPPAEPDDPADMLIMLADMARDMETSSPADAERIEWALAEIHRLQGIINRRDYYLGHIGRWVEDISDDVAQALKDPS